MNISEKSIVGELVSSNYQTAQVFQSYGIDFCCKGNQTIEDVCKNKNITTSDLIEELNEAANSVNSTGTNFQSWPIDLLADYIEKKHHRYVEEKVPVLKQYLQKICDVHGKKHPELFEIKELFDASSGELTKHMKKEELVLFPFIRKMIEAEKEHLQLHEPHFITVKNPIHMMMQEHTHEGDRFEKIAHLSNNYTPPDDACNTYRVTFQLLKEFQDDLHLHIHLENNILFPKAAEKEPQILH
jgi:regulator of cell morphogenesis and NO signaling